MLYSLKNFAITFILSAILFSVIAYFLTGFITDTMSPVLDPNDDGLSDILSQDSSDSGAVTDEWGDPVNPEPQNPDTSAEYDPNDPSLPTYVDISGIAASSFNVLLVGTDYKPSFYDDYLPEKFDSNDYGYGIMSEKFRKIRADTIMIVRVDKERRQFTFTSLPSNMRLFVGTKYTTIGELYTDYGIDYLNSKINAITGIPVDYYAVVNVNVLSDIMKEIGSVNFEVPYDIYELNGQYITNAADIDDAEMVLEAGSQSIDSKNVEALLEFNQYPDGAGSRMKIFVEFAQTLLGAITKPENLSKINQIYAALETSFKTNMALTDIIDKMDLIAMYDKFEHVNITYPGNDFTIEDEIYFNPEINEGLKKFFDYRKMPETADETAPAASAE